MKERVRILRDRNLLQQPIICPERARLFTESMRQTEGKPIVWRRAVAFAHVLEHISIYLGEDELLIGNLASQPKGAPIYPEYSYQWLIDEFSGSPYHFHERPGDKFFCTDETKQEILEIVEYWKGKTIYENFRELLPDRVNEAWDAGVIDDTWVSSAGIGNLLVDFDMVLNIGLVGVIEKAQSRLETLEPTAPGSIRQRWFLESVILVNRALIVYAGRLAEYCRAQAVSVTDPIRKDEILTIAANCDRVPGRAAQGFWEGLQSVWVILMALHLESNGHAISLGRFDQFLNPLLEKDLASGKLTKEAAQELVDVFFIKVNELNKLRSWPDTSFFLGYQMFVNLAVAGVDGQGRDAVNTLSWLCVKACEHVRLFTPSVSVKVSEVTDPEFIRAALQAAQVHKGGMPAFYNDTLGMDILRRMGIAEEDLPNWAPVGCIESAIQGKWDYAAKGPWLNIAKVLEITLHGGKDPKTGIRFLDQEHDLTTYSTMEEISHDLTRALHYFMALQVETEHLNDELHILNDQNAFRSSLVEDCIGRGKSLIEGGAIYTAEGGPTCGSITTGDALAAVETLLFKRRIISGRDLLHAMNTDFQDMTTDPTGPDLRRIILNETKRFGNDAEEADRWSVFVTEYIGRTYQEDFVCSRHGKGPIPACYAMSSSPVTGNIAFGSFVGALPNGKRDAAPVNNGMSPTNGAEIKGPTAAIRSMVKLPSIYFQKGAIYNVRLTPDTLTTPSGIDRVSALMRVFFEEGGQHIQFNVVGSEILKAAQLDPEAYQDLMVRVSGYSAFFTPLHPSVQNDLIERNEYRF